MKTIPELSIETKTIFDRLIEMKQGEILTFTEMTKMLGRDILQSRHVYYSAMRKALNEYRFVFQGVAKVGIKRLDDKTIACDQSDISRIRKAARRGRKKAHAVQDFDALSNTDKIIHNTKVAIMGVFEYMTRNKQIKKIEAGVAQNATALPPAKTLEMFK